MATTTERKVTVRCGSKTVAEIMLNRWIGGPNRANESWQARAFHPRNMEGRQVESLCATGNKVDNVRAFRRKVIAFAADGYDLEGDVPEMPHWV